MDGTRNGIGRSAAACAAAAGLLVVLTAPAGADFRHARIGPRPRALGSSFVAVCNDANAVYWNPSGLIQINRFEVTGCRTRLYSVDGLSNDYISMAYHWKNVGAIGLSWVRLGLEDIYHEDTINLAFAGAVRWIRGLSLGISAKLFVLAAPGYEQYNDPSYEGRQMEPSVDFGAFYQMKQGLKFGAVVYNVNEPKLKLLSTTSQPDPVYRDYAIGVSYVFRGLLLLTFDLKSRYGKLDNTIGHLGSELWFFNAVALRGGFRQDKMTLGMGLRGNRWQLDIMSETHNELGNTYQFSATIRL
jgi:hypothetical protein